MNQKKKTILAGVIVAVIIVILATKANNKLFLGKLLGESDPNTLNKIEIIEPDLSIDMVVFAPGSEESDMNVEVTITNQGPGTINADTPFRYAVFLDDKEVFSNIDSYSIMEPGDSFNFKYPISKLIYPYKEEGVLRAVVDTEKKIKEKNEENNEIRKEYFL